MRHEFNHSSIASMPIDGRSTWERTTSTGEGSIEMNGRYLPLKIIAIIAVPICFAACSDMSHRGVDTAVGAGVGAVGGAALTGGSALGTVGGAAVGGVVGNQIGK
jgi:osmotically inducible lipoprotein OsmB